MFDSSSTFSKLILEIKTIYSNGFIFDKKKRDKISAISKKSLFFNNNNNIEKLPELTQFLEKEYIPYLSYVLSMTNSFYNEKESYIRLIKIGDYNSNIKYLDIIRNYFNTIRDIIPEIKNLLEITMLESKCTSFDEILKYELVFNKITNKIITEMERNLFYLYNNAPKEQKKEAENKIKNIPRTFSSTLLIMTIFISTVVGSFGQVNNSYAAEIQKGGDGSFQVASIQKDQHNLSQLLNKNGIQPDKFAQIGKTIISNLDNENMLIKDLGKVKITAYNPSGPGLMAKGYVPNGKTATGKNANLFDGIAVSHELILDLLPKDISKKINEEYERINDIKRNAKGKVIQNKGVINHISLIKKHFEVYSWIEGIGFKIVDDGGGHLRQQYKKGNTIIDVRDKCIDKALEHGNPQKDTIIIIVPKKDIAA